MVKSELCAWAELDDLRSANAEGEISAGRLLAWIWSMLQKELSAFAEESGRME